MHGHHWLLSTIVAEDKIAGGETEIKPAVFTRLLQFEDGNFVSACDVIVYIAYNYAIVHLPTLFKAKQVRSYYLETHYGWKI